MMDEAGLLALTKEIESLGYDRTTAGHYAALIGDTPCLDKDGNVLVRDDDEKLLARLRLKFFGD